MPSTSPTRLLSTKKQTPRNQCMFASKMKCNPRLKSLSDPGLILFCQIAVNISYIYIYAMTSRFDLGNLGFAVKNPRREEIKKLPTANSKTSNDKKLPQEILKSYYLANFATRNYPKLKILGCEFFYFLRNWDVQID